VVTTNNVLSKNPYKLAGYSYSAEEAFEARDNGKLLCMRLDTNYNCNLECLYCYSYSEEKVKMDPMPLEEVKDIIDQASDLGLKSIVYLGGGEPTLYPDFIPLMEYMHSKDIIPVVFTNGLLMTESIAQKLYDLNASVIIKFDGFEKTQDELTGEGTFAKIRAGLEILKKVGFNEKNENNITRLGAAPCICTVNYEEIPEIWRYLRENFIFPDFERATVVGNATDNLAINDEQVYQLLNKLMKIDNDEFNIMWDAPYSSIPGHSCHIFQSGCHITATKEVALCPELPPVASLKDKSLKEIINGKPFNETRHLEKHIKEPCASCDYMKECFGGCRSKAYYCKGSLFAEDPYCIIANEKLDKEMVSLYNVKAPE